MDVHRYEQADGFLERAGDFLAAREAEHNLILGLSARVRHDPLVYGEPPYLAVVEDDGKIVAAALRTPPHNLVLSEIDDEGAIDLIAGDVGAVFDSLPGVVGPIRPVARFAELWQDATGARGHVAIAQRIFRADRVEAPSGVPGRMRAYDEGDYETAGRWFDEFVAEALPEGSPEPAGVLDRASPSPEAGWRSGKTERRSASPVTAVPRRTESGSGRFTPHRSCAGAGMRVRSPQGLRRSCSTAESGSASSSPTSPIRPRTGSTSELATGRSRMSTSGRLTSGLTRYRAVSTGTTSWYPGGPMITDVNPFVYSHHSPEEIVDRDEETQHLLPTPSAATSSGSSRRGSTARRAFLRRVLADGERRRG